jgi:DNA-binding response OmpR family regulator
MRVLLVEDQGVTARLIAKGLREGGYAVDVIGDGAAALPRLREAEYDVVVLDVMLPGMTGLDVCRAWRAAGARVPVLMLTALDAVEARIDGLDSGADDYLAKPFDFGELLARLRALVRRRPAPAARDDIVAGPLTLDTRTRDLYVDGCHVPLTSREYAVLECLASRAGECVSRTDIAAQAWDDFDEPASNVIDVLVQRLRKKIDAPGRPSLIRARRGEGYALVADTEAP